MRVSGTGQRAKPITTKLLRTRFKQLWQSLSRFSNDLPASETAMSASHRLANHNNHDVERYIEQNLSAYQLRWLTMQSQALGYPRSGFSKRSCRTGSADIHPAIGSRWQRLISPGERWTNSFRAIRIRFCHECSKMSSLTPAWEPLAFPHYPVPKFVSLLSNSSFLKVILMYLSPST
jgi:hypothetical protein